MRKFLVACLCALPVTALLCQPASAWCKFGFNINLATGGHKCAFDGGQPPCENVTTTLTPTYCPAPCLGFVPNPAAPKAAALPAPQGIQPIDYQTSAGAAQQGYGYYYIVPTANGYFYYIVSGN
jgi:hypothetical protein